jgi:hypothetical protein
MPTLRSSDPKNDIERCHLKQNIRQKHANGFDALPKTKRHKKNLESIFSHREPTDYRRELRR